MLVYKLEKYVKTKQGNFLKVIDQKERTGEAVYATLGKKRESRKLYYLVQFYSNEDYDSIYMPKTEVENCKELLLLFNKKTERYLPQKFNDKSKKPLKFKKGRFSQNNSYFLLYQDHRSGIPEIIP